MKVARQTPKAIKSPVYVTEDQYEIWYCEPRSLGKIDKRGGYWYTRDGMRFVSSRDAMEYLIRMQPHRSEVAPIRQEMVKSELPTKKPLAAVKKAATIPVTTNQNHPKFQEWLDFQNWQAQRRASAVRSAKDSEQ